MPLGSFLFGKNVAMHICRALNPALSSEADAIITVEKCGVYVNCDLPAFKRQYLVNHAYVLVLDNIWNALGALVLYGSGRNATHVGEMCQGKSR
eukprot:3936020-Ditylum_brightwellii.AAC.1